jgi:Nuclease-related domain
MAILIPSLGFARFDTRGELRLAERLKDFLEENAVVWHNLPVGPRNRHPDFIIVHPANGLLVLEVKDWRLESIVSADKGNVELLTSRGIVRESHPLEQARKYTFDVVRTLERDGQLLFPAGHRFMGKSIVPASGPYSRISRAGSSTRPILRRCLPSTCACSRMK